MIEANKKYIVWSSHYHNFGGNNLILWSGPGINNLTRYFPTWKELQSHPIKAIKIVSHGSQGDAVWLVLSLRHGFKFHLNSALIKPAEISDAFSASATQCVCDSRKLFAFGCDCGGN